nr:hypothetical protein [Anaerobutyricum hallii]
MLAFENSKRISEEVKKLKALGDIREPYFSTQTAMAAHIALAPLKSAAIRHGINAIVADIYNVAAAYDNPLADAQKILLRQSR